MPVGDDPREALAENPNYRGVEFKKIIVWGALIVDIPDDLLSKYEEAGVSISSDGKVHWGWHITVGVFVSDGDTTEIWAIDPSIASVAVPVSTWVSLMEAGPDASVSFVVVEWETFRPASVTPIHPHSKSEVVLWYPASAEILTARRYEKVYGTDGYLSVCISAGVCNE